MKTLLIFGSTWPEPASSAGGTRTLQLLDLFLNDGWDITFYTTAKKREHSAVLPVEVHQQEIQVNCSELDPLLIELQPDLVWFDRFMVEEQFGWRVSACCPKAKRIVDTIDLHCLREIRRVCLHEERERTTTDWFSPMAMRELASIYRSDLSLLISDAEYAILTTELGLSPTLLHITPFLCNEQDTERWKTTPSFEERSHFATIGNFRHPPNADSVRYVHDQIWPMLQKACPDAELHIYGADVTPALQNLHRPERGFHIKGRAQDALETLSSYRVCLAPLRYGAGLKGKLLDAMLSGTPSVTTSMGAEGMQGTYAWPGDIEDDPLSFVQAATKLHQQPDMWENARKQIPALLNGHFNHDTHSTSLLERIHHLLEAESQSSIDQLTGAILRHHHHRSTEYMSRWIEAKNRRPSQEA